MTLCSFVDFLKLNCNSSYSKLIFFSPFGGLILALSESYYEAIASLENSVLTSLAWNSWTVLLSVPFKCWKYSCEPPCPVWTCSFSSILFMAGIFDNLAIEY